MASHDFGVKLTPTLSCHTSSQESYACTLRKRIHKLIPSPSPTKPQGNEFPLENISHYLTPKHLLSHTF